MAAVSKQPFTHDVQSTTPEQSQNSEETSRHYTSSNPNIQDTSLLHLSFNQDHEVFAAGTDQGFRLYNCEPFGQRDFVQLRGIGVVEMLFRSNIIALVGGGSYPEYPPTKVMFWDNFHKRCIGDLDCKSQVRAVRLRRDRVIVVLNQQIKVYNFTELRLLNQIVTVDNPNGLCEISQVSGSFMLVCPGLQKGQVRIENYTKKTTKFISAHDSGIACIALSQDEKLLATASTKGTLVRIFSTLDGSLLQEVRRGAYTADIYSIAFSPTAQWLALSSDKGTVHVFAVKGNSGMPENNYLRSGTGVHVAAPLSGSSLSFMKRVLPKYFSSECSVAQFRLPEDIQFIVAFGQEENTIVIVGMDGSFYRCKFDLATGGEMIQLEFYNFLSPKKTF